MFSRNSEEHAWRAKRSAKPSSLGEALPPKTPNKNKTMEVKNYRRKKEGIQSKAVCLLVQSIGGREAIVGK